jgi:hypothetical protein
LQISVKWLQLGGIQIVLTVLDGKYWVFPETGQSMSRLCAREWTRYHLRRNFRPGTSPSRLVPRHGAMDGTVTTPVIDIFTRLKVYAEGLPCNFVMTISPRALGFVWLSMTTNARRQPLVLLLSLPPSHPSARPGMPKIPGPLSLEPLLPCIEKIRGCERRTPSFGLQLR